MIRHERQKAIVDLLARRRKLSVDDLQRALRASPATIRRDLADLQRGGALLRVHGGVLHPEYLAGEPTWTMRARAAPSAKLAIAVRAAALVRGGQTVFLDAGTTSYEIGRRLLGRSDVVLFTISLPLLEAAREARARVIGIGGEYRRATRALVGELALAWLRNLRFDLGFIGAAGLSAEEGVSTTELREAAIKEEVLGRSRTRVLAADGSKWERPVAIRYAPWSAFDIWVTDADTPRAAVRAVVGQGVKVIMAGRYEP